MNKELIKAELLKRANADLTLAKDALESASKFKFETDMLQEHKYDTRSIEANYLSQGQEKRVEELKLEVQLIEEMVLTTYENGKEIQAGDLLEIELNEQKKLYFLSTTSGGTILNFDGETVMVISVFSPIGSAVLGLTQGDEFELETKAGLREYKIVRVF